MSVCPVVSVPSCLSHRGRRHPLSVHPVARPVVVAGPPSVRPVVRPVVLVRRLSVVRSSRRRASPQCHLANVGQVHNVLAPKRTEVNGLHIT